MRTMLSILMILLALLIIMMLLPLHIKARFDVDNIYLEINYIFRFKLNVKKLVVEFTNPEVKKSKTKMDKAVFQSVVLKELRINYISGDDEEKLLYINSLINIGLPLLEALLKRSNAEIYYKGRKGKVSSLKITSRFIVCPIYVLIVYIKSRRKCRHEEKRTGEVE